MGSKNKLPKPPGQMVDIGGFRLHAIVCGQGTPTVILEPALGGFAQQYAHIQPAVSTFTRVMAYDRAGQGWSDVSPNERKPVFMAGELRSLLGKLDLQPPYVLVGHSLGGMLNRIYAGLYPDEVAGMVLVDATHVDEYAPFHNIDKNISQIAMAARLQKIATWLGLGKQVAKLGLGPAAKMLSEEDLDTFLTVTSQPKHQDTLVAEFSQHRRYFGQRSQVPSLLSIIPLMVVTAENSISGQIKIAGSLTGDQMNVLHQKLQKDLVRISPQGEQILVHDATHMSILFQPEHAAQVVDAIRQVVEKLRNRWFNNSL